MGEYSRFTAQEICMKRLLIFIFFVAIISLVTFSYVYALETPTPVTRPDMIQRTPRPVTMPPLERIDFVHIPRRRSRPTPVPTASPQPTISPSVAPTPSPTPSASCPNPDFCNTYGFAGVKWMDPNGADDQGIAYVLNLSVTDGLPKDQVVQKIAESLYTWEVASNNKVRYKMSGETTKQGGVQDFSNTISFADLSRTRPGALAVTTVWYRPDTRAIIEFDMVFNTAESWSINSFPVGCSEYPVNTCTGDLSSFDFQNVAVHEAGHTLMLLDLTQSRDRELTMYGYAQEGELKKRTLGIGDMRGIQAIYP